MGRTQIFYEIPIRGHTTLRIYDLQGRVLRTLVDADLSPGQHHLVWDGRNSEGQRLSAGIYFAKLMSGTAENVQRVIFVR
jgi:flagellar hook assembly protein FlgD